MPILVTARTSILLAFKSLPLLLIGFVTFLAFGLGNPGLFILLIGQSTVVPFVTSLCHFITKTSSRYSLLETNDVSQLIPTPHGSTGHPVNVFPSYWMAHISFFFGYLLGNAIGMFTQDPEPELLQKAISASDKVKDEITSKVAARKGKAWMLITSTLTFFAIITFLRVIATGAETVWGITLAVTVFGGLGGLWYWIGTQLGSTNSDIFGIAMQMMSVDSAATRPKTCVYTGAP